MKKIRLLAWVLAAALLFAGCARAPMANDMPNMEGNVQGDGIYAEGEQSGEHLGVEDGRKLIRTVTIDAETDDLDALLSQLDEQLKELGGYVQDKTVRNGRDSNRRYATMTLRIPVEKLDAFVGRVEDATNILSSSEKAEDVTLRYTATKSQIKALETEEARLLELMEKAQSLNDLLALESRLADVRRELETVQSQLKVFDSLIDYGTLHLTITEVKEYTPVEEEEPTVWERIGTGFVRSLQGVWKILTELFVFVIVALPYLVIPVGVCVLVILLHRRNRKKRAEKKPAFDPQTGEQLN